MALSNLSRWTEDKTASACGAADMPAETPAASSHSVFAMGSTRRHPPVRNRSKIIE